MSNKHVCIYSPMSLSSYFRRRHAERALSTVHKVETPGQKKKVIATGTERMGEVMLSTYERIQ